MYYTEGWYLFISFQSCGLVYFPPLSHLIGSWTWDLKCRLVCKLYQWCERRHLVFISGRRGDFQRLLAAVLHITDAQVTDFVLTGSFTSERSHRRYAWARARVCCALLLFIEGKCRNLWMVMAKDHITVNIPYVCVRVRAWYRFVGCAPPPQSDSSLWIYSF